MCYVYDKLLNVVLEHGYKRYVHGSYRYVDCMHRQNWQISCRLTYIGIRQEIYSQRHMMHAIGGKYRYKKDYVSDVFGLVVKQ